MSKRDRELTEEDKELWRRVSARVKARRCPPGDSKRQVQPKLKPQQPVRRSISVDAPPASQKRASPAPQDRGGEKRVRRGKLEIGGTLDLHGHNQETARTALGRFLRAAQARGDRTVIVVTGVGRAGQGILKRRLPEWLSEGELRPIVSGVATAHRTHGGEGAFYVFIRRRKE